MKLPVYALLLGLAAAPLLAAEGAPNLADKKERISYYLGVNFGSNIKKEDLEVNLPTVIKGLEDSLAGNPKMSEEELRAALVELQAQVMTNRQLRAEANKAAGEKWLEENSTKPGVKKTASGLQYKIIEEGSGESPKANDEVMVKYTGKLIDGTEFDSTDKRGGQPAKFRVDRVIRGWSEGIQLMKKGAKWELYIPAGLAYGERPPRNSTIPANAALIFEVELVDVIPAAATPPAPVPQRPITSENIIKVPSAEEMKKGAKVEILSPEDVQREIAREKARKAQENKAQPAQPNK